MTKLHRWLRTAASAAFFIACTPVMAQWQVPDHSVPVGRGSGTGFKSVGPCSLGYVMLGQGASADPACSMVNLVGSTLSSNYSVTTSDINKNFPADISGGTFTISLPAASTVAQGFTVGFTILPSTVTTAYLIITPNGADTIDGLANIYGLPYQTITLTRTGSAAWRTTSAKGYGGPYFRVQNNYPVQGWTGGTGDIAFRCDQRNTDPTAEARCGNFRFDFGATTSTAGAPAHSAVDVEMTMTGNTQNWSAVTALSGLNLYLETSDIRGAQSGTIGLLSMLSTSGLLTSNLNFTELRGLNLGYPSVSAGTVGTWKAINCLASSASTANWCLYSASNPSYLQAVTFGSTGGGVFTSEANNYSFFGATGTKGIKFTIAEAGNQVIDVTQGNLTVTANGGGNVAIVPNLTLGISGSNIGALKLAGNTSGTVTIVPNAAAGAPTLVAPNTSGTLVASATTPLAINSTTGVVSINGLSSTAQGDILYGSAANTISALAKDTNATRYLSNTGTSNNPAWAQVNLANGVTGTLPVANGGTGDTGTAWTTYTPSLTCFSGSIGGTSTATGRYKVIGKTVFIQMDINVVDGGTCATQLRASLPSSYNVSAANFWIGGQEYNSSGGQLQGLIKPANTYVTITPCSCTTGFKNVLSGIYETN